MKKNNRRFIACVFISMFGLACCAYLLAQFAVGIKLFSSAPSEEIGKIKYVDSNGNDIFAQSNSAVIFECPINMISVDINNNVAHIQGCGFSIVRAPAYGVVESINNNTIIINHGNSTYSTISGLSQVGVIVGDLVLTGYPIGASSLAIDFSVDVADMPLDMHWLFDNII